MDKVNLGKNVEDIALDDLKFDKAQVRTTNPGKDIHELAESIRKIGLLEPIVVCPAEGKGKYEIIAGQRRYLAHREIGVKTIKAVVIPKKLDEFDAKTISLSENWHRTDLSRKDERNVCLILWRRYKSVSLIIEETGLQESKVRKYLKFEALIKPLKKSVDAGEISLDSAARAQAAASVTGTVNEEEAVKIAKEMEPMIGVQRKKLVQERKENPEAKVDDVIEKVKSGEKLLQIVVTLTKSSHRALQKYASVESITQDSAAGDLIELGLTSKGFI